MAIKGATNLFELARVNRESNRMVDNMAGAHLSKDEIRIIAKIVEALRPQQNMKKRAEISKSKFGEVLLKFQYTDLVPENYKRTDCVIEALNSLRKREANTFSENVDIVDGWISRAKHYKRDGRVEIIIGEELLPDYIALGDGYTEYMKDTIFNLNSKYAIHIYKLLARNRDRKYFNLYISHLRKYLNIDEGKYKTIKDFKRRILLPAFEELRAGGDVYFDTDFNSVYRPEENEVGQLKKGRKVIGYRIKIIDRKARAKTEKQRASYLKNFIISFFEYTGISQKDELAKKTIRGFANDYGTDEVIQKLTEIKGYVRNNAKKKAAYTLKVLQRHFAEGGQKKAASVEGLVKGQRRPKGNESGPQHMTTIITKMMDKTK